MTGSVAYWISLNTTAAFVEEMWRGYCLTLLAGPGGIGAAGGLILSSVAFGLAHSRSMVRVGTTCLLAAVLGVLFLWGKSQWATVGAHMTVNIGTVLLVRTYAISTADGLIDPTK
jgi:membrane protease YdiL (CAAX protease family)